MESEHQTLKEFCQVIDKQFVPLSRLGLLREQYDDRILLWNSIEQLLNDINTWTTSSLKEVDVASFENKLEKYEFTYN